MSLLRQVELAAFLVEFIMFRLFGTSTVFLVLVLGAHAGEDSESKAQEFARDIEQLNGSWISPKTELGPGVSGIMELKLDFKKDSVVGQATFLNFFYPELGSL